MLTARTVSEHLMQKSSCSSLTFDCGVYDVQSREYRYDPYLPTDSEAWKTIPYTRVTSLEEMLPLLDVLSLHVPLLPSTRDMISLPQLKAMKPTAIIINTARGGIVNETDLWHALRERIIKGAGIDTWVNEPPTRDAYGDVFDIENLTMTSHIGGSPLEIQTLTCYSMCDRMKEMIVGEVVKNRIV